jgi:hypothetical protein
MWQEPALRCGISIRLMTGVGQTLPSRDFCGTAALPLKPDIGWRGWHVRKVPTTVIGLARSTTWLGWVPAISWNGEVSATPWL